METCFKQVFNFNFVLNIFRIDSEREKMNFQAGLITGGKK